MQLVQRRFVLIASPSDVLEERAAVCDAINRWNNTPENIGRSVVFVPLLWEMSAVADADLSPQEAINKQLLGSNTADIIAIFNARLGTPTKAYLSGTVEEITKRKGKAAVFFSSSKVVNGILSDEELQQLKALSEFQTEFESKGFALRYNNVGDIIKKTEKQLGFWANLLEVQEPGIPIFAREGALSLESFDRSALFGAEVVSLLMYNVELISFYSAETFENFWSGLDKRFNINKVILLLPDFKMQRLKGLLRKLDTPSCRRILNSFYFCEMDPGGGEKKFYEAISSSISFILCRRGHAQKFAEYLECAQISIFSEPFSTAGSDDSPSLGIKWAPNYCLELHDKALNDRLSWLWRHYCDESNARPVSDLFEKISLIDDKKVASTVKEVEETVRSKAARANLSKIELLRSGLFDPNVPSYVMDQFFTLLDWNAAFDLVFPTDRFYRLMPVTAFIDCLSDKEEVIRKGIEMLALQGRKDPSQITIHVEKLTYLSPIYGKMSFIKVASSVIDKEAGDTAGWIVALNVTEAEHLPAYQEELKRINEYQSWISSNASLWDRLLPDFAGYEAIVNKHLENLSKCRKVLDLGAGLGVLSKRMKERGIYVTSVEANDALIRIAETRCGGDHAVIKSRIDRVHFPQNGYPIETIGIDCPYDGIALQSSYHWIDDPVKFLKRLHKDDILSDEGTISISLFYGKEEIMELCTALERSVDSAEDKRFIVTFKQTMISFSDERMGKWWSTDEVAEQLSEAGYEILRRERIPYKVKNLNFRGIPYFLAKGPSRQQVKNRANAVSGRPQKRKSVVVE